MGYKDKLVSNSKPVNAVSFNSPEIAVGWDVDPTYKSVTWEAMTLTTLDWIKSGRIRTISEIQRDVELNINFKQSGGKVLYYI